MVKLTPIAESILQERYYDKDEQGNYLEDWEGLSRRVAVSIATEEGKYGENADEYAELFYDALLNMDFMPNTPCLMNAGSRGGLRLLSACFVQVPDDSLDSIMQHAWHSAKLFQAGAGVGYNFSNLRSNQEFVKTAMRKSSGSISFMKNIFNSVGEVVKQGGRRRAAMMGLLEPDHPEIQDFIEFKNNDGENNPLANFNISIFASDDFMRSVEKKRLWALRARTSGDITSLVGARDLFDKMIQNNWAMAEPGMIWSDSINNHNPLLKSWGPIRCVNPCGEATLYNYENCCLGSVNLANHVTADGIDWVKLARTVRLGIRFLDDVVDANVHVAPEFSLASLSTRRIGLGVTGFADLLVELGAVYGSEHSFDIAHDLASFIADESLEASKQLAEIKGPYPAWEGSWHQEKGLKLRNVSGLAIAPEGSRSLLTNTSASIEPNFGREIVRTSNGIGSGTWKHRLADNKSFVTSTEVPLAGHIKMQAVWQEEMNRHMFGQSISKTITAPNSITTDELGEAYLEAWRLGCKGFTTYRDGSRDGVYYEKKDEEIRDESGRLVEACATGACDIGMEK